MTPHVAALCLPATFDCPALDRFACRPSQGFALELSPVLTILVVDDNKDAADSLALFLQLAGYTVQTAYNGPAGLRAAEADLPACVVLDINMPGTDGLTVARGL